MNRLRALQEAMNGKAIADTVFVLLGIVGVVLALVLKGDNNIYAFPFVCAVAAATVIAVILLIAYSLVAGREYLKIISYILLACSLVLTAIVFVFTSEYEEPNLYYHSSRFRPVQSGAPMQKNLDICGAFSADRVFDFEGEYQKIKADSEAPHKTDFIEFFKKYKLRGTIYDKYTNGTNDIRVETDFGYYYKLPDIEKSDLNRGIMNGLFEENPTESGEQDGIKYFYFYKKDTTRLKGGTFYAYFQKENVVFTVKCNVYSNERIYLDKEKIMEKVLSAVIENKIMD